MITPFRADGSIDLQGAAQVADHLVSGGCDGVVVAGTTGESPTLTPAERIDLYREVLDAVAGRAQVVAGTGNYCTSESIELTRQAEKCGVHGIMLVVPYYNNPPQEGLYAHFSAVAAETGLPVLLYNVTSRAPRNLEAATVARLAEKPNIRAVKEASGRLEQVAQIIRDTPDEFRVYSGDDSATLPLMSMGAYGVISVVGHVVAPEMRNMIDAFAAGRVEEAAKLHCRLLPVFQALFCAPNPIPVKAALAMLGLPAGPCRLPLVDADEAVRAQVLAALQGAGKLPA